MRILHFSDIHLDPRDMSGVRKLVAKMIRTIKADFGDNPAFDLVVFSGDMILSGGQDRDGNFLFAIKDGFAGFKKEVMEPICAAFGLPQEQFIVAIGNHAVDWALASSDIKDEIKNLKSDKDILPFYQKYIEHNNAPWIKEYNDFRNSLYSLFGFDRDSAYANLVLNINGKRVGISLLNSAWGSLPGTKIVLLEQEQLADAYDDLEDKECDYKICVMHNPYQCFNEDEQSTVLDTLLAHYDVCFTGHTHLQKDHGISHGIDRCYLSTAPKLRASTMDVTEHDDRYKDGFVIFEENESQYVVTKYKYRDTREFELEDRVVTDKTIQHHLRPISVLFEKHSELDVDKYPFLFNDAMEKVIDELISNKHQFIRLSALSGFGKTRLLYQAFSRIQESVSTLMSNVYYCETYPDDRMVFNEIKAVVDSNSDRDGIIILDNCNWSLIKDAADYMHRAGARMRLIGVDNNPYDNIGSDTFYPLILPPDIIKDKVDEYIDTQLSIPDYYALKEDVKRLADGYPSMAYHLVDTCKSEGAISVHSVDDMVRNMLMEKGIEVEDTYQLILQAMALFQPMPTQEGNKDAYNYIVGSKLITHIQGTDFYYRKSMFKKVARRYSPMLIEQTPNWMCVRPFPLALWLIGEWFDTMDDEDALDALANDIMQQPEHVSKLLVAAMCKRVECMQDSIAAKSLIEKLTEPGKGSFCREKVVCSEMGSRLFLAMATVNPEKVAACLQFIFKDKDTEWIRTNVTDTARRNLVWALNKLCFAHESFDDAVIVMAQFSEAENEYYSNNSRNSLSQLFPIQLPDTEVDLKKRADTIELLWMSGYKAIALKAIDTAFKNRNFMRMGGAEKFGWHHRDSYWPQTYGEVFQYWSKCRDLLLGWYAQEPRLLTDICKITENHVSDWDSPGLANEYLFPLIDVVAPALDWNWKNMYELLNQLLRFHKKEFSEEMQTKIQSYINKLEPRLFADTLMYTGRKVFDREGRINDVQTRAHELMQPLANRFVDERIYANPNEIRALAELSNGEGFFTRELKDLLKDEQIQQFLDVVWTIVEEKADEFVSPIVNGILGTFREKEPVSHFKRKLYESGYKKTYVRILAALEDDGMQSYLKLLDLYHKGEISYALIEEYMNALWGLTDDQMLIILPSLKTNFPHEKESILDFVMKHRYWTEAISESMRPHVRDLLLSCKWIGENGFGIHDRISLIESYLQKYKEDVEFAVRVNKRLIELLGNPMAHRDGISGLYTELLQEPYQSAIWDDFAEAFANNLYFTYHVQYEIGSGFTYGAGPLFQYVPLEKLQRWCDEDVKVVHYLASMAPVFKSNGTNPRAAFSDFLQWLIDKYGNDKDTVSGISSNLGTMSWTGSPIPLYEDIVILLTPYLSHKYPIVREWAQQEITQLNSQIEREKSQDDFMRMHYS